MSLVPRRCRGGGPPAGHAWRPCGPSPTPERQLGQRRARSSRRSASRLDASPARAPIAPSPSSAGTGVTYTVRGGDTLFVDRARLGHDRRPAAGLERRALPIAASPTRTRCEAGWILIVAGDPRQRRCPTRRATPRRRPPRHRRGRLPRRQPRRGGHPADLHHRPRRRATPWRSPSTWAAGWIRASTSSTF